MSRARSRRVGLGLLFVLAAAAGGLAVSFAATAARGSRPVSHEPADSVARPAGVESVLPAVAAVRDFDGVGDRLYLLDPLVPAVHRVEVEDGRLVHRGSFGRRGGGPGEFSAPTGIAVLRQPAGVAVIEPGRIHVFDLEGRHIESVAPALPCATPLPRIAAAARGIFVHADCVRRSAAGDTMAAVLFWSPDGRDFTEIARDARYSMSGGFGDVFAADTPLGEGNGDLHAFGAGVSPCVFVVDEAGGTPAARRECDSGMEAYSLELREETRRQIEGMRKRNPSLAGMFRVPDRNAMYAQALVIGQHVALVRGYSEDSLVLRRFGSQRDAAVLPRDGWTGCRRSGCLYADPEPGGTRLRFVPAPHLEALLAATAER